MTTEHVLQRHGCALHYWLAGPNGRPLLVFTHGEHDRTGNIRQIAPRWAARDPHSRYEVIPDAGHTANQDAPQYFNRLLQDFLRFALR